MRLKPAFASDTEVDQTRDRNHNNINNSRISTLPVFYSNANTSPISSDNFSDPALASISPRKPKSLSLSTSTNYFQETSSRQPARDHGTPSPSASTTTATTATRNTGTTHNFSTSPSAISSTPAAHSPSTTAAAHHRASSSSLIQKRPPASRSSNGIETSLGPPPALSTRRSQSHDKPWSAVATRDSSSRPQQSGRTMGLDPLRTPRSSSSFDETVKNSSSNEPGFGTGNAPTSSGLRDRRQRASFPARSYQLSRDKDSPTTIPRLNGSLRTISDRTERDGSTSPDGTDDTKQSEDLFLNLAKDDASRHDSSGNTERRRKAASVYGLPSRLRATENTPSPGRSDYDGRRGSLQDDSPLINRTSSTHRSPRSPATAHPLDESSRLRYFGVNSRSALAARSRLGRTDSDLSTDMPQAYPERRGSTHDTSGQPRPYRSSYLGGTRTARAHSGADRTERARLEAERARHDGTESALSTTAPSTVWDELDDLKSRIRTLERTGKFPPSSAAAMSSFSGERPRTATTTVTTMSSSPKHTRRPSSPPQEAQHATSPVQHQIHNLLLSALSKAKPRLNPQIYLTIEAAATDALSLSTVLGANATHSSMSVINGSGGSDRQMRRKADGVCRSLTELCLALSEGQETPASSKPRPVSQEPNSTIRFVNGDSEADRATPTLSYRRSTSHEPEELRRNQVSFNLTGRNGLPEPRRKSMLNLSSSSAADESSPAVKFPTQSRLNRSSTLRSRRLADEGGYDDRLPSISSRPISRAMTEAPIAGPKDRFHARDRNVHQSSPHAAGLENQPLHPPRATPSAQSSIPLRRNYATPTASHLAATSHSSVQPGFRRYPGGTSGVGLRGPLERDRDRTPTQADMTNSSPVDTPSRDNPGLSRSSTMGPLRTRTNSFGTRRMGLRPRNSTLTTAHRGVDPDGID